MMVFTDGWKLLNVSHTFVIHQLVDDHLKDWLICGTNTKLPLLVIS